MSQTNQNIIQRFRNSARDNKFQIVLRIFSIVPLIFLLSLVFAKPVTSPFVDDWTLIPWLLNEKKLDFDSIFSLINGHQYAVMKLFLWGYGNIIGVHLFPILLLGIVATFLSMIGALNLLPYSMKMNFSSLVIGSYFVLTLFSFRQMQNIFMIICIPWVLSLLMIVRFANLMRQTISNLSLNKMIAYAVVASFTSGLGLILCIYSILLFAILPMSLKSRLIRLTILAFSIFFSFILPQLDWVIKTPSQPTSSPIEVLKIFLGAPIESGKFIAVLIAQPQIPWNLSYMNFGVVLGSGILVVAIIFSIKQITGSGFRQFIQSNPLLLIGFMYVAILYSSRFRALGAIGALEPRYTTGSIILLIGTLLLIVNQIDYKSKLLTVCLLFSLFGVINSGSSGLNYYLDRFHQQESIKTCLGDSSNLQEEEECFRSIFSLSLGVDEESLRRYVEIFFKERNRPL
jgi:hypothetical protein